MSTDVATRPVGTLRIAGRSGFLAYTEDPDLGLRSRRRVFEADAPLLGRRRRAEVVPCSQVVEEGHETALGLRSFPEFFAAEAVYLIAPEPQLPILGDHLGVALWIRFAEVVGIVLFAVAFDDDADPVRQQEQEVHALAR